MTNVAEANDRIATRIRDNNGLSIDADLRKRFPAIFNTRRSVNVSEDYQLYRSDQVIDIMHDRGLKLVEVGQERVSWSRKRHPHTQIHIMRFRDPRFGRKGFGVGDSWPEIVVKNSHDGRCLFSATAGVFRLVCSNGMVIPDVTLGAVSRRHYGEANAFEKVREIIAELPKAVKRVSDIIVSWDELTLSERQQIAMAKKLMEIKMPSGYTRCPDWLKPQALLEHRRDADAPAKDGTRSAWLTFNVLQEALTNSTISHQPAEGRARSIRPINGVVDNIGMNSRLWTTAEAYVNGLTKGKQKVPA